MQSLRGNLGPELFRPYAEPIIVPLRYEEIWKDPFPEPAEAEVRFDLGGERRHAFVPLFIVDEENQTVQAALLGEQDDCKVVWSW